MKIKDQQKFLQLFFSSSGPTIDLNMFRSDLRSDQEAYDLVRDQFYEEPQSFKKVEVSDDKDLEFRTSLKKEKIVNDPYRQNFLNNRVYREDPIPLTTYKRMSYDPTIRIAMNLLRGMASSLKWDVETNDPKIRHVCRFAMDKIYKETLRECINISFRYGWYFAEKVWDREIVSLYTTNENGNRSKVFGGYIIYPRKIKGLDPFNDFRYYKDPLKDEIYKVSQYQPNKSSMSKEVEVKREKLFWFALDKEFGGVFGESRFRAAYKYWYNGSLVDGYISNNIALAGQLPIIVRHPPGETPLSDFSGTVSNEQLATEIVRDILEGAAVTMSSEVDEKSGKYLWDVEFRQVPISDLDKYKNILDHFLKMILMALGVPSGILDGDNNASELDAKIDLFFVIFEELLDQLENAFQKEILDWIVQYNFGHEKTLTTRFKFDRNGLGRRTLLKEVLINLLRISTRNGAQPRVLPDIVGVCEDLGIPTAGYKELYMEDPYMDDGMNPSSGKVTDAESEANKIKRQDAQNGIDRVNPTPRNAERPAKAQNITDKRR